MTPVPWRAGVASVKMSQTLSTSVATSDRVSELLVSRYPVSEPPERVVPDEMTIFPVILALDASDTGASFTQFTALIVTVVTAESARAVSRARYVKVVGLALHAFAVGVNTTPVPTTATLPPETG
jgi:hypothetical protein